MSAPKRQPGFTLIELLIVVAVMSIMAAALVPNATPVLRRQLEAGARAVAADVMYCRSLAVTNMSNYRLTFNLRQNNYVLEHSGANTALNALPASPLRNASDPPNQHRVALDDLPLVDAPLQLIAVQSATTPATATTTVEFGPLGETTNTAETAIWLACGGGSDRYYQAIRVNPITGLTWIDEPTKTPPKGVAISY